MRKLALLLVLCLAMTSLPLASAAEDDFIPEVVQQDVDRGDAPDVVVVSDDSQASEQSVPEATFGEDGLLLDEADSAEEPGTFVATLADPAADAGEDEAEPEADEAAPGDAAAPHTDPDGPQLASNEVELGVGEAFGLKAHMPEENEASITYESSDEAVATVTSRGKITAVAVGDACVKATADDGTWAECFVHVRKAPDKVALSAKKLTVGKGESVELPAVTVGSREGEFAGGYTFKSANAKIVKITSDGLLKGVGVGKTSVIVTTYNGKKATLKVTVVKAPSEVTLTTDKAALGIGETGQLRCALPKGTASGIDYQSDDDTIVSVDAATGEILGVGIGSAVLTATTFNGKTDSVTITVGPAPDAIAFEETSVRLGVGMELPCEASLDEGAVGTITYTVKKQKVATFSNGVLKGVARGKTTLVARTYNGLTAKCTVTVVSAPKKVRLPYKTLDIGVQQSVKLQPDVGASASTFTYTSSAPKILSVSEDGTITGLKRGSASVVVRTYNGKKCKLKVNVLKEPASVALEPDSLELAMDETAILTCVFPEGTASAITYESSDETVAAVDPEAGVVTGVGPGKAEITVTTRKGKKATAEVTVYPRPEWIELSDSMIEIAEGQAYPLSVELSPDSRSPLRFTSADKSVATVSDDGVITGTGLGETDVTVETNAEGVSAQVHITVLAAPAKVKFKKTKLTLNVGETTQLSPVITEGSTTVFTYTSSKEEVATVSEEGMVVALAKGKTTLKVTTHNGLTAKVKLTVLDPWFPESIVLKNAPETMKVGESVQLEWDMEPEDAVPELEWASTNESVATVDEDSVLHGNGMGWATITAVSHRNPAITLEFTVSVGSENVVLAIPARTTDIAGIPGNLARIDAIRRSAMSQVDLLVESGVISGADASKRRSIISNAFKDYAFPWMTLKKQSYWKRANSENGRKDFQPGRVYYGLPYISGSGGNREYNAEKALREKRYYSSGKGYYILDQSRLRSGRYCGNDCSCFVDAAIWGTESRHSDDRTGDIMRSDDYRTISGFSTMRPGDLICIKNSKHNHVVLFLYYVNAEKTKIMIIENGGTEKGTNTVHCIIMDVKYYSSTGYKVRRLRSLG